MYKPLHKAILAGRASDDEKEQARWARLEADIDVFVTGEHVTDKLIKQLLPRKFEHWELRSTRPKPSLRVFGRFGRPNVFIGTHACLRKDLGGMNSPEFEQEKLVCEEHWKAAALPDTPFTDAPEFRYERYITENAGKHLKVPL